MPDVKELAKWLEEEVEFLENNQDYVGGWYLLPNNLAAVVLWEDGWGDEVRDDAIQAEKNPDWALCAGILVYNPSDTPDGWFMPWDSKTGDIICETTGIMPNEDYETLAKFLIQSFNEVKDCEIKSNGEVMDYDAQFDKEEDEDASWDEKANVNDGEKPWDDSKHFDDENESLKEGKKKSHYEEIEFFPGDEGDLDAEDYIDENGLKDAYYEWDDYRKGYVLYRESLKEDKASDSTTKWINKTIDETLKEIEKLKNEIKEKEATIEKLKKELSNVEESCKKKTIKEKVINEDKEFHSSPYHDIIAEYFDYDSDFEFLDVVASILGRVDNFEDDEDIYQAIDDELIYTYDQWTVLEHYCTPQDANWEVAWENLSGDIFGICAKIAETNKMSEEEPEEENDDNE